MTALSTLPREGFLPLRQRLEDIQVRNVLASHHAPGQKHRAGVLNLELEGSRIGIVQKLHFGDLAPGQTLVLVIEEGLVKAQWPEGQRLASLEGSDSGRPINTARLGSSGRNILRGPGFFTMNQNVSRTFYITERIKLQFLGEAFNLTNTPSFSNPATTWAAPTLNADGSVRSYNGYSVITGTTSSARQVGAVLRF
jgi:hypothetical protein